jgi:hypothetical protein
MDEMEGSHFLKSPTVSARYDYFKQVICPESAGGHYSVASFFFSPIEGGICHLDQIFS